MKQTEEYLLEVRHLKKYFKMGKNQTLKAVDDVSFILKRRNAGIVGESDAENDMQEEPA